MGRRGKVEEEKHQKEEERGAEEEEYQNTPVAALGTGAEPYSENRILHKLLREKVVPDGSHVID